MANSRPIVLAVGSIALAALTIFGVSRCVVSCSTTDAAKEVNEQDARVAVGVSTDLTASLTKALDQAEQLEDIAARANELDSRLVELALHEPAAIGFVASYDPADGNAASTYDTSVTKGSFPTVFCWDKRWGATDFAGGPLAITGSGPVALFIARTGLRGNADLTPSDIAAQATEAGAADTTLGMSPTYLTDAEAISRLNLTVVRHDVAAERIGEVLEAGTVIMLQAKENSVFGEEPHWILATSENADGTVMVCDPTSPEISARPWATSTLANAVEGMYAITATTTDGAIREAE